MTTILLVHVIIVGILSRSIKFLYILLVNLVTIIISVLLGVGFITAPNPSWFNPFGMELVIVFTGILLWIGHLIVRVISNMVYRKKITLDQ
ncbi:hypothetical protein [Anaerobacillus arseniciselenatis]|uniref:hypothetical protein n=1 Tax=Anaerobacillus arseniciselenatis TaxID=85682 RepID=UPI001471E3C9|nr:hypothetical protein [Anaerobacillus arseniciselenatis]